LAEGYLLMTYLSPTKAQGTTPQTDAEQHGLLPVLIVGKAALPKMDANTP
jgi:hypothetical protein